RRWSTAIHGSMPSGRWYCRRRPLASPRPPSSASSSPGTSTPAQSFSLRGRRRQRRPSFPSSSARGARTGRRWRRERRCSLSRSLPSLCCCAGTCCAASPSARCASDARRQDGTTRHGDPERRAAPVFPPRTVGGGGDRADHGRRRHADAAVLADALRLLVRDGAARHGDVHRRLEVAAVATMAEIRVENLQKSFGSFAAVRGADFTVGNGEFFCLLGPSGCGKTTTLRMIAGLELPTGGRIFLGPEEVTAKRASERDIAFVFQLFARYTHKHLRADTLFLFSCLA